MTAMRVALWLVPVSMLLGGPRVFGAHVILNEYNAVGRDQYLNGGTAEADDDAQRAGDLYFGRVPGNGGDWFELVVITDHLDMRHWSFDLYEDGQMDEKLELSGHAIWSDLRSGTIITVAEDVPTDVSYNPEAGDWWINVQACDACEGAYIEPSNFSTSSSNWQIVIRDAANRVVFGPAGEGIAPASGIGNTEVFFLKGDPSAAVTPLSADYDDGTVSTFGQPNVWDNQEIGALRSVVVPVLTAIHVVAPAGTGPYKSGTPLDIAWENTGPVNAVRLFYLMDNGAHWIPITVGPVENTGLYTWMIPLEVESEQCRVKVADAVNPAVFDMNDLVLRIYRCALPADLNGDCLVDIEDLSLFAEQWLLCDARLNPACP